MMEVNLMEKTELTVSMEPERLDALRYFLAAKNKRTPQVELQRALEELYETYVPAETRAYLDAKCRPNRPRPRRPGSRARSRWTAAAPRNNG